jgi:hypothetical protein
MDSRLVASVCMAAMPFPRGFFGRTTALLEGLLTPGSWQPTSRPSRPARCGSVVLAAFVPGYSGGAVPDLHRIPLLSGRHTTGCRQKRELTSKHQSKPTTVLILSQAHRRKSIRRSPNPCAGPSRTPVHREHTFPVGWSASRYTPTAPAGTARVLAALPCNTPETISFLTYLPEQQAYPYEGGKIP